MPEEVALGLDGAVEVADVERALSLAIQLASTGNHEVKARDFMLVAEPDDEVVTDLRRLGMALRTLGIRSRRARVDGSQIRVYDLGGLKSDRNGGPR